MKSFTRKSYLLGFLLLKLILIGTTLNAQTDSILVDGIYRTYELHLPANYNNSNNYPVVYNFHGIFSNGLQQQALTNFNPLADSVGCIVVYPNAVNGSWNIPGDTTLPNDSSFVAALLDTINANYSTEPCKIYATGFSQGGFMSYVLACMFANRFAAIAVVSGNMFNATVDVCYPSNPIPIMHIHGTADPIVLYWGIIGLESWVPGTVFWWAQQNNCALNPINTPLPNPVTSDSCDVNLIYYAPGIDSSEVIFIQVNNGGHTWPGSPIALPFGFTNYDFSASLSIWNFFNSHTLKGCSPVGLDENNHNQMQFNIYPNPFHTQATIELPSNKSNCSVVVYDLFGRKCFSDHFSGNNFTLTNSLFKKGIYFICLSDESGNSDTRKFIVE
jgi:polyhydroxybutyrate depolymerase